VHFKEVNVTVTLSLQGLFAENKEKLITGAITALLAMEGNLQCFDYGTATVNNYL